MPLPNPIRFRLAVAVPLLGLVALLSCQNDTTGPKSSTATVSTTLTVDPVRLPDSVSWKALGDSGAFHLTITSDTSFRVQATLPQPLGSDTLTLSAWTLSLRTATALFHSDAQGNLLLLAASAKDSLSIRLLQAFDSLRTKSPAVWGTSSDSKAAQIASLQKAYATLLLARDAAVSGFPTVHPVGIDSLAVVDQLLLLSVQNHLTYHALDSLVPLDSANLRAEVRTLAVSGKLDSNAIFPPPPFVPNHAPSFAGALSISRTFDTTSQVVANWITAVSPGPANESSQIVHFEVVADSGASFFSVLPSVDSAGTLRYQAKSVGRGVFRVRAHDNGDSTTGSSVNVSGWTTFTIQLFSRPVLIATGPADTVRLVEDSASTVSFSVQNFVGSSLAVKFTPVDTTLISAQSWKLFPDANGKVSISLQGKQDVFGGPLTTIVSLSDSLDQVNLIVPIGIAERNHPPTFGGVQSLVVTASAATRTFPVWIDSISPGPASESYQKVSFQVQVLSGSSLFAKAPSIDSTGRLSFAGNASSSGLAQIQVRAVDNDSVDPGNRYSAWKATSIYFNQPPTLIIPTHALSTWENQPASVGATTVTDQETSPANLSLTWTTSDSAILPVDSVFATFSGGTSRNITLHPVAHRWGAVKVVFTLTDSLGGTALDSLSLTVNPINHAPTIVTQTPGFVYSYKGDQPQPFAMVKWDDVLVQTGHVDMRWPDTQLVTLSVDSSTGVLHVAPKLDTAITIKFQIRARDNGGTLHGGVDTSNWSDSIPLQIVDTVQDAQGNDYRVKVMGSQTWMAQNVRTSVNSAVCAWGDCQTYGRLYLWNQVMSLDGICNTTDCSNQIQSKHQGICPTGWHVPRTGEWRALAYWAGDGDSVLGITRLKAGGTMWRLSTYMNAGSCGYVASPGYFGFDLYPSSGGGTGGISSGSVTVTVCAPAANYWAISKSDGIGALVLNNGTLGGVSDSVSGALFGQFRCMKDVSERPYFGVAP